MHKIFNNMISRLVQRNTSALFVKKKIIAGSHSWTAGKGENVLCLRIKNKKSPYGLFELR